MVYNYSIITNLSKETLFDPDNLVVKLKQLLASHQDKKVVVIGTTCTGKSTFISGIPNTQDMDDLVFPLLSQQESDYVCQTPWTPEIGQTMTRLTKERVKIEPGKPVFGTVLLDSDLVVELKISDHLLLERTQKRGVDFEDAKKMQQQIKKEIEKSGIPAIEFNVG